MVKLLILFVVFVFSQISWSVEICGHRGARGLAPENTLEGFAVALKYPIDCIDMDVTLTKDNEVVLYHDLFINPDITRDYKNHWIKHSRPIKDLNLNELQTYNVGQINPHSRYALKFPKQKSYHTAKIPTLAQALTFIQKHASPNIRIQIELKTDPIAPPAQKLVAAVEHLIAQQHLEARTKIQAFDWRCLQLLQKRNPHIQTAYLTEQKKEYLMQTGLWTAGYLLKDYGYSVPKMIKALHGTYWDAEDVQLNRKNISQAHLLGLKVYAWSNTPKKKGGYLKAMQQLIKDDVDGIITDRPDLLLKLRQSNSLSHALEKHA